MVAKARFQRRLKLDTAVILPRVVEPGWPRGPVA
jgi:hypothetical protein